jgi:hypothetical protein
MSRIVIPGAMLLHSTPFDGDEFKVGARKLGGLFGRAAVGDIPVGLRWTVNPTLGIPRQPFEVWRRPRELPTDKLPDVPGGNRASIFPKAVCEVVFNATPAAGQTLVIDALGPGDRPLPGQRIALTAARQGLFRAPAITGLRLTGEGAVTGVRGTDAGRLANAADWELIEIVGLPVRKSDAAPPVYDGSAPQGRVPAALDGIAAALRRLQMAQLLVLQPPDTGVAGAAPPAWPPVDPGLYLKLLREGQRAVVPLLLDCLKNTDDTPEKLQGGFRNELKLAGLRQFAVPGAPATEKATTRLPIIGTTMLAVATDSDAAVALGFGAVDMPPKWGTASTKDFVTPPGLVLPAVEFMVTAKFNLLGAGFEFAALAFVLPPPVQPAGLAASQIALNRPPAVNQPATESVLLRWKFPLRPQGHGILSLRPSPAVAAYLNAPRLGGAGGFDPYAVAQPASVDGGPPGDHSATFTDPAEPVPLSGSAVTRYFVAGRDVFARWSRWSATTRTASAPPVTVPGLHSSALTFGEPPDIVTGTRRVRATLEIEFSWDFTDRQPASVEFHGKFIPSDAETHPDPHFAGGFLGGVAVKVTFANGQPSSTVQTPPGFQATIEELSPIAQLGVTDDENRRFRLWVTNVELNFGTAASFALSVTARGAEAVRPAQLSAVAGPQVARASDPLPLPTPGFTRPFFWTALPDAARRARAVLEWTPTVGALGYVLWEATETALRAAVGLPAADRSVRLRARATALEAAFNAARPAGLRAFSRVTERPITEPRREMDLPGDADTLFIYLVTSLTGAGVESARDGAPGFAAVPRLNQPAAPRLQLRAVKDPAGVQITAFHGRGPVPAKIRLHRVSRAENATDLGLMGPAVLVAASQPVELPGAGGVAEKSHVFTDPIAPSWLRFHYRAVAVGRDDPDQGEIAGESDSSAAQSIGLPPPGPPGVIEAAVSTVAGERLLTFKTDLPVRLTGQGTARINISQLQTQNGSMARVLLAGADTHRIPQAAAPAALNQFSRGAPGAGGMTTFTVRLAAGDAPLIIVVTDPLGRTTESQPGTP